MESILSLKYQLNIIHFTTRLSQNPALPELNQLPNSIACTDDVSLLHEVFRIPNLKPEPKSYPSRQCDAAQKACDHCVKQTSCANSSEYDV